MFKPSGKVVLITGGANGVGAAVAREFLNHEAKFVAVLDIDDQKGCSYEIELANTYGADKIKYIKCDLTNDKDLTTAYSLVQDINGYIDVVINSIGIIDEDGDMFKKLIEVNITSVVASTLKALDIMRIDKGGKGGTIINISSVCGLMLPTSPTLFIYSATKAAVLQFTTLLGMEAYCECTGVRTMTGCPNLTDTNLLNNVKSFDPEITRTIKETIKKNKDNVSYQTPEFFAKGLMETFKKGTSGSVWVIQHGEIPYDVTHNVRKGYDIMSEGINVV